jgi:hypothetical protein
MADGKGCTCAAHSESECGCDADWTPQEVYDLRAENERLREAIRRLAEQDATLSVCAGHVTVQMDAAEWIPVSERLPEIAPEGVSVTVIAAHVGYDLTMQGFVRTGELCSSPAAYIGSDESGPWFKSMVNGRRLDAFAWMPLPSPPTE